MGAIICGICLDGLCEDHARDCVFAETFMGTFGPCACQNGKKTDTEEVTR